jgi:hypothetical protein
VTNIGDRAFSACISLTSITIPDSVTSIGDRAFADCLFLKSIAIPDSVTNIGKGAFASCISLTEISVNPMNQNYRSDNHALFSKDGTELIALPGTKGMTEYVIPYGVTSIGEEAFAWWDGLTSITIPDSVTSIGDRAFYDCRSLTSITIPDSVTSIGKDAFSYDLLIGNTLDVGRMRTLMEGPSSWYKNLTIHCSPNSFAERYATIFGIPHAPIPTK